MILAGPMRGYTFRAVQVLSYDTAIQKHLRPGEQLRWVGRARSGWLFRWQNRIVMVQIAGAICIVVWLSNWVCQSLTALVHRLPVTLPSTRTCLLVLVLVGFTIRQMYLDRRRRAGTWYAVTDGRILFVLTTARPESVIAINFDELAQISLNDGHKQVGPKNAVILQLKQVDPYLASSTVLGYQVSAKNVLLEDLESPQEFYEQVVAAKAAHAALKA